MANEKEDKGFQIPIEDASEEVAEGAEARDEATAEGQGEATVGGQGEAVAGSQGEPAAEAQDEAKADAQGEPEPVADTQVESEPAADAQGEPEPEESAQADPDILDDSEIVAEAEGILEDADIDTLEEAQSKAKEWQDRYLRLHAEWDTYRRRTQEQRAEEKVRATEKLMENLLPVLDDFERTVAYAEENGETGLIDGVKAVQSKLVDALTRSGLEVIDPAGQPYDALEAQAVQMIPDEESFEETVKDVFQKGYKMGKKVLRAAMVTVTTGGPKRPKEESEG